MKPQVIEYYDSTSSAQQAHGSIRQISPKGVRCAA